MLAILRDHTDLINNYLKRDHQIYLSHDLNQGLDRQMLRPDNPYSYCYFALQEAMGEEMENRTIRGFHYTRLTDNEVTILKCDGIHLSTPDTLKDRLGNAVASDGLAKNVAEKLYAKSPFHSDQLEARENKYWMVSHPLTIDDGGVVPLMLHWGGEVASMWASDQELLAPLTSLGLPRIIEVAVPLRVTKHSYAAGSAVIATFAQSLSSIARKYVFDFYTKQPLPPSAITAVHTEGEISFCGMGKNYPRNYIEFAASPE